MTVDATLDELKAAAARNAQRHESRMGEVAGKARSELSEMLEKWVDNDD